MNSVYGGTEYEMFGIVNNLCVDNECYTFNLSPIICTDAGVTDGNTTKPASILVCRKLVRSINGMQSEGELFFVNRKWKFKVVYNNGKIEDGQLIRVRVVKNELERYSGKQMRDDVEVSAQVVLVCNVMQ